MNGITIIFSLTIMIVLLTNIDAEKNRHKSDNALLKERLLDLVLEAKRRGYFDDLEVSKQQRTLHNLNNYNDEKKHSRRKFVGIYPEPYEA